MKPASAFTGGCHCGQLRLVFSSAREPASIIPRACDCTFCLKHAAAYVSDPAGRLVITVQGVDALRRYRQGSNTAEFLLCGRCGVLVAVVVEDNARIFGAVNARALEGSTGFGLIAPASPQGLASAEKIERWSQLWVPDVELALSGTLSSLDTDGPAVA